MTARDIHSGHGLIWNCDSVGLVHSSSNYPTCPQYVRRIPDVILSDESSYPFQEALGEHISRRSIRSLYGLELDNCLAQGDFARQTDSLLEQYRLERDEAIEIANLRTAELVSAREELLHLKEEFHALRVLFDELADCSATETTVGHMPSAEIQEILTLRSEKTAPIQLDLTNPIEPTSHLLTPPPSPTPQASRLTSPSPPPPTPPTLRTPYPLPVVSSDLPYSQNPRRDEDLGVLYPRDNTVAILEERSIARTLKLMEDAREGDQQALLQITTLYTTACQRPLKARTSDQQFIVLEWKNFHSSLTSAPPACLTTPDEDSETPEIFVDSSFWGVGFSFNGRWLAWQLKPGWKKEGRDNNWGEMVAVELGLRVAIAAGFVSQTIVMRSDNWGVVHALMKGKSKHPRHPEIMRQIKTLTEEHGIDLIPVWVSTKENPADDPSRGAFPSKTLVFPVSIPIPQHLSPFISMSIKPSSLCR